MSKTKWFVLIAALFVCCGIALVLVLTIGFFAGNREAAATGVGLPIYKSDQTASTHAGHRRNTLTSGTNVFVNDYEEDCLQLATTEPAPAIGHYTIGNGTVCAVPGQPVSAYIAGDVGSEMPAYVPYRSPGQPPFDWRTASYHEMTAFRLHENPIITTNAALMAEVVRVLRDDPPVALPPFTFTGITNLTNLKLAIDTLPGLLFCPYMNVATNGTVYLAESLVFDTSSSSIQLNARWIPASPTLTLWLKSK